MTTQDTTALESHLNRMILSGQGLDAFEKYYAEDVVMQEGNAAPREGKDVNREYERQFFASIAEFHGAELHGSAVNGDRSYSEWTFDVTLKNGTRVTSTQVAARIWENGQITSERFYAVSA